MPWHQQLGARVAHRECVHGLICFTAFLHQLLSKNGAQDYDICLGTTVSCHKLHGKFMALFLKQGLLGEWSSRKRSLVLGVGCKRQYGAG